MRRAITISNSRLLSTVRSRSLPMITDRHYVPVTLRALLDFSCKEYPNKTETNHFKLLINTTSKSQAGAALKKYMNKIKLI